MKHKLAAAVLSFAMAVTLISGCGAKENQNAFSSVTPLPVATANPDITHPEGRYYTSNNELKAEGGLTVLGSDFLKIMIDGQEIEFALSENAKREISIYNKDENNPRIMRGTMLLITYTERDLIKIADTMDIINSN